MSSRQEPKARTRRIAALISLVAFVASVVFVALSASRSFPRGLIAAVLLVLAFVAVWEASLRRGAARTILTIVGVLLVIGFVVALIVGEIVAEVLILAAAVGRRCHHVAVGISHSCAVAVRGTAEATGRRVEPEIGRRQGRGRPPRRTGPRPRDRADRVAPR